MAQQSLPPVTRRRGALAALLLPLLRGGATRAGVPPSPPTLGQALRETLPWPRQKVLLACIRIHRRLGKLRRHLGLTIEGRNLKYTHQGATQKWLNLEIAFDKYVQRHLETARVIRVAAMIDGAPDRETTRLRRAMIRQGRELKKTLRKTLKTLDGTLKELDKAP